MFDQIAPSRKMESNATKDAFKSGTFLVVDDYDSMRKVTSNQLKHLGILKVVEASNGAEALKIIQRQPIAMVLSDWNMPIMDGLELLTCLRSQQAFLGLPFLMITAETERSRVEMAVTAGVSDLLVKPYTAGALAQRIERALSWQPRKGVYVTPAKENTLASVEKTSFSSTPPTVRPEKATILVVDDTPDNLTLLAGLFRESYRVKLAHTGEKAIGICQSDTPPDLVLLDIMMPGMDGFEVARALRAHPSSEHIPIIFVTALNDEESRLKGMELGAVDFVTKPIQPDLLKIRVNNFIRYVDLHRGLQSDYDKMMEVSRLKEEVEHITRHDIKGPLAGALGLAQGLFYDNTLNKTQLEQVRMIEESVMTALNLINLSAEIYKIEIGQFVLKAETVQVAKLLHRLIEESKRVFITKNLSIRLEKPRAYSFDELLVKGDSTLCYSAFQNLLKNACEAAPDDSDIVVTVELGEKLSICIENSGVVPASVRGRFFDKFATEGKQGGTGLGTYSAKLLIEAQDGSIQMQTDDTTNLTRVVITLPIASA